MDELKAELQDIKNQIKILKKRKASIEKELMNESTDFKDKFMIWFKSDSGKHYSYLVRQEDCPLMFRKVFENIDAYRRGETIYLENLLCDEVFEIWTQDVIHEYCKTQKEVDDFNEELAIFIKDNQPLLEEAMNKNIKSFKLDW